MIDSSYGAKRLSEGHCPLCGEQLTQKRDPGRCGTCATSWTLTKVDGRAFVQSTRALKPREVRKLITGDQG